MLGAGRPEDQVPLLAADGVVALTLGEGAPIPEPLVGGPVGRGGQQQGGRGVQGPSGWDTESEGQGETPQFTSGEIGLGREVTCTRAHSNLRAESCGDSRSPSSQNPGSRITPHTMLPFRSPGAGVERHRGRGCSERREMHLNRVQDLGEHPCLSRITLPTPILKAGSLPRVPINVTTQSDLGLWLDLSFQGRMLQDHRAGLNPCSRGHGCTVRGRAEQRGRAEGRTSRTWRL